MLKLQLLCGLQDNRNTTKTRQKHCSALKGLTRTYWPEATKGILPLANSKKTSVTKVQHSKPETLMDKTTRIVRKMANDDAEQRQDKTIRLRKAPRKRSSHAAGKHRQTSAQNTSNQGCYKAMIMPSRFVLHSALSLTITDLIEGELSYTFPKSPNQPSSF